MEHDGLFYIGDAVLKRHVPCADGELRRGAFGEQNGVDWEEEQGEQDAAQSGDTGAHGLGTLVGFIRLAEHCPRIGYGAGSSTSSGRAVLRRAYGSDVYSTRD